MFDGLVDRFDAYQQIVKKNAPKKNTRNLVMVIEYDGTNFAGWQSQPNHRCVQTTIAETLSVILDQNVSLHASGRTDAGVHALGQVAHCRVTSDLPISILYKALNSSLPPDIRIVTLKEAPLSFHVRKDAVGKEYHYWMYSGTRFPVFLRHYVFHPGDYPVNWSLLKESTNLFLGSHDFTSFSASGSSVTNMVREIHRFETKDQGNGFISFQIVGNGFLYKMVRLLLGEIWMVQRGKKSIEDLRRALSSPNRAKNRFCVPPHGLYLARVYYSGFDPNNGETPFGFPFVKPVSSI